MVHQERRTFVLYSIGHSPEQLCLGHLVYNDYANPTQGLYSHFPRLRDSELEQHTFSTPFSGLIARSHDPGFGFRVQLPEVAEAALEFNKSKARALLARSGRRIVLRNPEEFLRDQVLKHEPARSSIMAWVSAAGSALVRAKAVFRPPRIWFLTGLYELVDTSAYDFQSSNPSLTLGVDGALLAALTAAPVGAAIDLNNAVTATSNTRTDGPAIWAAQWQRLDVRYFRVSEEQQGRVDSPLQLKLLRDGTYSRGTLLAGNGQRADAVELNMLDLESDDAVDQEAASDEAYDKIFARALRRIQEDHEYYGSVK